MAIYANRIKRKKLIKDVRHKIKRIFNLVSTETSECELLHDLIWKDIRGGLDCGYDIRYNFYEANDFMSSLESEFRNYYKREPLETELDNIIKAIDKIYITKYDDLQLNMGKDEKGKYFTVEFV